MQMAIHKDLPYALDIRACACSEGCVHGSRALVSAMRHIQLTSAFVIILTEQRKVKESF